MYSQNNINKMRRLSNTTEMRSQHSTIDPDRFAETVKLPALNAIAKSVKYGDLSFTMDRGLNKLRKEPEGSDSLAENLAHNSLMTIRKKYDNVNKERQEQESLIHELEIEKEKFKIENTKFQHQKAQGDKKVKHLQQEMNNVKLRCEEAEMQKKVVCNMMQRLKSDKIVFDQRKYVMQHSLKFIAKQKEIIVKQRASMKQEEDNTKKIYYKMVEHIEEQQRQRQNHLRSLQNMIHQKTSAYDFNFGRQSEMIEIAENTLSEKDNSEKKWYKVYLCQRFVQRLLRDKMAREMKKFGTVEAAFKNIKTETGVTTTEELVKKFLNKEGDYGDLLGTIADNQKQILKLKTDNQQMNRQRSKLRTQRNALTINKRQNTDLTKEEKELHFIDQRSTNCELYLQKLAVWLGKAEKKIIIFNNEKVSEVQIEHKHKQIVGHFTIYLNNLLKELQTQKTAVQNDKNFDAVNNINNLRIQVDSEKSDNEKKPKQISEFDQGQHVNNLRLEMLRNNDKHMKELKKKYEEIKRQRLEAEPKKKDVSPEKPKVPVPPAQNA